MRQLAFIVLSLLAHAIALVGLSGLRSQPSVLGAMQVHLAQPAGGTTGDESAARESHDPVRHGQDVSLSPRPRVAVPVEAESGIVSGDAVVATPQPVAGAAGVDTAAGESTDAPAGGAAAVTAPGPGGAGDSGCWQRIGLQLNHRVRRVPAAVRRHAGSGTVVVRFSLASDGRAHGLRVESRSGSALLEEAVLALFAEPFAGSCAGEGRWPVEFVPNRTARGKS